MAIVAWSISARDGALVSKRIARVAPLRRARQSVVVIHFLLVGARILSRFARKLSEFRMRFNDAHAAENAMLRAANQIRRPAPRMIEGRSVCLHQRRMEDRAQPRAKNPSLAAKPSSSRSQTGSLG